MTLDSPDINHTPIHMEEKQDGESNFNKAIEDINLKLALDGLKIELPKTKEEQEKEVLGLVKVRGLKKSFEHNIFTEGVTVKKIKEGIFSIISNKTGNINYFVNEKGDIIFGLGYVKERLFIENGDAYEIAGYIEKKEDGKFNMYKVVGKNQLEGPIDINSPEYYKAWTDINFYADYLNKLLSLKHNFKESKLGIHVLIKGGSFKFEDLEEFKKRGLITSEIFDYGVEELRKVIVSQCSDERLIKLKGLNGKSSGIKESDLRIYLKKGYITNELAQECYKILPD